MTKYLQWSATAVLVLLSVFLIAQTKHTLDSAATTNTVSFSGQGKTLAKPDVAILDLSIVTEATTSKAAQDENSKKSKSLTDFLKKQNIEDKDIKTTAYNIYPQYTYPPYGKPTINGYQVNQSVQVKIRDLTKSDVILDGVVSAGVNQVNNFQLTIDDPNKLMADAREKAIQDAKEKAKTLQDQLGIHLGRIVNFSESGSGTVPPIIYDTRVGMGGGAGGPSVPTGENEITVNVTITYQIK